MKIITWNINGYRAITGQNKKKKYDKITQDNKLFDYIRREDPDIICLQETKAHVEQINEELRQPVGYEAFYHSSEVKKGYSGVATFTKHKPEKVNYKFGVDRFDQEGRLVETDFGNFVLMNVYFPKGYADSERLNFKLDFYDAFFNYAEKLRKQGRKLIVSGDYNTAHKEIDLARPKENVETSGFMPVEREKLDWIVKLGYVDTFRMFTKESGHYIWWSWRGRARENNVGWRIDYNFVTEDLSQYVKNAVQQPEEEGSDHCPVVLEMDL